MIMVLRRWFVPAERLTESRNRCLEDVMPAIRRQPGCVRVEMYESSIRDHWVTAITWENDRSRAKAVEALGDLSRVFAQYERFEPEVLILRSSMH